MALRFRVGMAFALACAALGPAHADAAPEGRGLAVRLVAKRPLRLARSGAAAALEGRLEVTFENISSDRTLKLPRLEVHGLVFRPDAGGAPYVMVHSCQCVHDATKARWEGFVLLPGMKKTLVLDDFGCADGPFPPPPPGRWQVAYRTHVEPDGPLQQPVPAVADPAAVAPGPLVAHCRDELTDDARWVDAVTSNALAVILAEPPAARPKARPRRAARSAR